MATAGVSHGIDLCARMLAQPGDVVLIEDPVYTHAADLFRAAGLKVVGVPQDMEGLIVDQSLEEVVQTVKPTLFYTVPIHNNPTGATLSPERRAQLVALAQRYGKRRVWGRGSLLCP